MNPVSPKTYSVINYMLTHTSSSQRKAAKELGVSIGQVNKVFHWLEENLFIERTGGSGFSKNSANHTYTLINPTGILRAISFFRKMKDSLLFEANIDLRKEKAMEYLVDNNVIFCLESALARYDSHFRGDTVCCYVTTETDVERLRNELGTLRHGITKIRFYSWDFKCLDISHDLISTEGHTTEVQTVVDLFCDYKPHYTKELLKRRWGIIL